MFVPVTYLPRMAFLATLGHLAQMPVLYHGATTLIRSNNKKRHKSKRSQKNSNVCVFPRYYTLCLTLFSDNPD